MDGSYALDVSIKILHLFLNQILLLFFFLIFFGKIKLNEKNPLSAAATGILSSLLHLPEIFHQAGNAVKYDTYMTAACNCGSNILYIFSVYLLKYQWRKTERRKKNEDKHKTPIQSSLPQVVELARTGPGQIGSQQCNPSLPCEWQEPSSYFTASHLHVSKELD